MKPSLQLRIGQSLTMTPQLQQAIRLLQLSSLELQTEVQEALESNMMLELDEEEEENEAPATNGEAETGTNHNDAGTEAESGLQQENIPDDLPVDSVWDDIYDPLSYQGATGSADPDLNGYDNQSGPGESLHDYLRWQLNLTPTSDTDRAIALAIIDALDDDGYLTLSLEEIHESLSTDIKGEPDDDDAEVLGLDEVRAVLHIVQAMDPPGIAATDLRACLLIQLHQLPGDVAWKDTARQVVDQHLQLLAAHDYNALIRQTRLSRDELQQVLNLIQSLNPRPGGQVQNSQPEYIIPDVYVKKDKGVWRVELNGEAIPQLRINSSYAQMVRRADNSSDNNSLKSHLQEARWFIKSLQSRSETLLRVASAIVERQQAFLEHGEEAMKPLVLHDIAEALGMHESTISRVTTRKYMHTPRGIFELKYFFSSHVNTSMGGTASSTSIRAQIKKLISEEPPQKPLSDSKIASILSDRGIEVARRTVAKYREAMSIPPSNERKHL